MRQLFIAVIILAVTVLASCGGAKLAPQPSPTAPPQTTTANAVKLYETNCAVCHGQKRQGIADLAPLLTPASLTPLGDEEIRDTILKGRPGTAMAGFEGRLSETEINSLVRFLKDTSP